MFKVISSDDTVAWDAFLSGFESIDVYFRWQYFAPFGKYTGSDIVMFAFEKDDYKAMYVMQINDIAKDSRFTPYIPSGKYFDTETPYGYGGVFANRKDDAMAAEFFAEAEKYCKKKNVVTQFFRFHPLYDNYVFSEKFSDVVRQKSTVYIDLSSASTIWENLDSKNRNVIKKAVKSGVEIKTADFDDKAATEEFKRLYYATMDRNKAEKFYYFDEEFFRGVFTELKNYGKLFYAVYDGKVVSSSIILFGDEYMHYFLSGADRAYMSLAPNNLLLYSAAVWGSERGYKKFHLGGGLVDGDSLFSFKKSFNKKGLKDFYIGRNVFDKIAFDMLVDVRKDHSENFDTERKYLIKYRQD